MNETVNGFRGEYAFLSNFYNCPIEVFGFKFANAEAAFQSQKVLNRAEQKEFCSLNGKTAKQRGRRVKMCDNRNVIKLGIMEQILEAKFTQNEDLALKLIKTDPIMLVEHNTWGDRYWGVSGGTGMNTLGNILMALRKKLKNGKYTDYSSES